MRKKLKVVTFKIDDDLYELLEAYTINHRVSRAEAIRRAIKLVLQKEKEKQSRDELSESKS